MEKNKLLIMNKPNKKWCHKEISVDPKNPSLHVLSFIVCAKFINDTKIECDHVWVSYRQRSMLVSFDAKKKKQRCTLDCKELLRKSELITLSNGWMMCCLLYSSGQKKLPVFQT